MDRKLLLRTAAISLCLLGFATASFGQNRPASTSQSAAHSSTEIIYTGKSLGYFRVPSLQEFDSPDGCPGKSPSDSTAATEFLTQREKEPNAILVGTGDNFAPQLEARVFSNPPQRPGGKYAVGNKELYFGKRGGWVFYEDLKLPSNAILADQIKRGIGIIPTDNVGCFLRAARYSAIVPGKHDFYFGAERVRQFARFLASESKEKAVSPVQMLGANLVITSMPIVDKPIPPGLVKEPWFKAEWSTEQPVLNLKDGVSVYPWFSYVKIQVKKPHLSDKALEKLQSKFVGHEGSVSEADLKTIVREAKELLPPIGTEYSETQKRDDEKELDAIVTATSGFPDKPIYVCASTGDPNQIPKAVSAECEKLDKREGGVRLVDNAVVYYLPLKPLDPMKPGKNKLTPIDPIGKGKNDHFSTLLTGQNYGLCSVSPDKTNCLRFSVLTPFFYFPHRVPGENQDGYTDPDPYVVINNRVAVFGVVDPDLGGQVGILNFGWLNTNKDLTTRVNVEDPAEALKQQLDYFERKEKGFSGLKILLAQTSPQRARVLAARFPAFQVVVSAADLEQGTSEIELRTTWKPSVPVGSFVAVPTPYFDGRTRQGTVHFGMIKAENAEQSWILTAHSPWTWPVAEKEDSADEFWSEVKKLPNCKTSDSDDKSEKPSNQDYLKWLVLCAMRERVSADVALIQTRDLFDKLPDVGAEPSGTDKPVQRMLNRAPEAPAKDPQEPRNVQQTLDRLIWKGDLLTLLYVPGSALKKALQQSKTYADEEDSSLSLVVDRGRKLEKLGIRQDKVTKEYLINELPLDEKKIYAVATTDYIGAGDTGYPDLTKAALNPRTHPAAFPKQLISISSLVCRKLYPDKADAYCLGPITSSDYLDETVAAQTEQQKPPGLFKNFWDSLPLKGPGENPAVTSIATAVEQRVQRRGIWLYSLKDFSLGFNNLGNNLKDAEIDQKFAGNPTSGVQAKESKTFHIGLDTKLSRSSHSREFFIESGIDYQRKSTGDIPSKFQVNQLANRLFADTAFVFWRRPGRPIPNLGLNLSLHAETQLQQPFSTFTLNNADKDLRKISQGRSLLLLPRLGMRWQNKENVAEIGAQAGRELNALLGYRFNTAGGQVECLANSAKTFGDCIKDNSATSAGITKDSPVNVVLQDRPRAGMYFKANLSIPFGSTGKYQIDQEADYFFVNFRRDTSLDTRFRDITKQTVSFAILPSVSIGPMLRLLFYQNKVNRDFLFQREFGIETKISFDIFNRREKGVQVRNKPQ